MLMLGSTYDLTAEIMFKHDVYKPINDVLKEIRLEISGFEMEKMSSISKEKQIKMGIKNPVIVPSPMAINISVESRSK